MTADKPSQYDESANRPPTVTDEESNAPVTDVQDAALDHRGGSSQETHRDTGPASDDGHQHGNASADVDPASDRTAVTEHLQSIPLVPVPTRELLDHREQVDYASHRRQWLEWALSVGKDSDHYEGYSVSTMESRAARVDRFFRWLWTERACSRSDGRDLLEPNDARHAPQARGTTRASDGHRAIDWRERDGDGQSEHSTGEYQYTTRVTGGDADAYLRSLAFDDASQEHKSNTLKALRTYFAWRHDQLGDSEWEPERTFGSPNRQASSGDALDRQERRLVREAALEYGSVPHYNSLDPDERDRWKAYLAQRFEKSKAAVTKRDWERANDWKYPTLVWTSLDAALRPIEVERATVDWVDLDRGRLVIPKEADSKARDESERRAWTSVLTDATTEALQRWLYQRECYDRYEGRDELWLTKYGNPYDSGNLSHLIDQLCEIAGIDTSNRQVSWYSIRRGTITQLIDETDLSTAAEQARHRDIRSTRRYDQAPDGRRRDALERLG